MEVTLFDKCRAQLKLIDELFKELDIAQWTRDGFLRRRLFRTIHEKFWTDDTTTDELLLRLTVSGVL